MAIVLAACSSRQAGPAVATFRPATVTIGAVTATASTVPAAAASSTSAAALTPAPSSTPAATPIVAPTATLAGAAAADPVLVAAGDIASCLSTGDEATAQLVSAISPTAVATLGDNVYERGSGQEFKTCFDPSWGAFKDRLHPTPGNHEYETPGAQGYFTYYAAAAGKLGQGYYSYDVGAWHVIVLNSQCWEIGGCGAAAPQSQWLKADLAAHTALCTLAYWHVPRFSSGAHGDSALIKAFWDILYAGGADVVLNGHDHDYERFAPQDPQGQADPARGIREFVAGTGGRSHYPFLLGPHANSEVRNDATFGVLKLTLHTSGYDWQFVPVAGKTFTDAGIGTCH